MKKNMTVVLVFLVVFAVLGCGSGGGGGTPGGKEKETETGTSKPLKIENCYESSKAPDSAESFNDKTALQFVADIKIGWNLGNTLDANADWLSKTASVSQFETAWGNPVTTQANINALKTAGFNAIRIPVSWAKCAGDNYVIRKDWMDRVTEVVNYAVANDMYIILNSHHDESVIKFTNEAKEESLIAIHNIWMQIAVNFKNYDEKLIFEALNEPRTPGSSNEWGGGTAEERSNLNEYYQAFVDVVRASGGNNNKRFLLINPYAASKDNPARDALKLPADTATDKLIVSFHSYEPYNFALNTKGTDAWSISTASDKTAITNSMDAYKTKFIDKGIPVLIGEFGAMNKDNTATREAWAAFYVSEAKSRGIPCFWWDNGAVSGNGELFGLLNRKTNAFTFEEIVTALMNGVK